MNKGLFPILILSLLITATAGAACPAASQSYCFGNLACTQLLEDTNFNDWDGSSCISWVGVGWTSYHSSSGSDEYWEIQSWGGSVYQQYTIPSDALSMDAQAVIYLIKNSVGSERIRVQITNTSGTVLQTLGTYYASSSGTTISFSGVPNALAGQTVRLLFTVAPGSTPGDTLFRITQANIRSYPF